MTLKVLGIDLACKTWQDNGTCLLSFNANGTSWDVISLNCIKWPSHELTPAAMADALVRFIRDHQVIGISLDGPQGWREPNAPKRYGVGRVCEYEARCQGKTGEYRNAFPRPQLRWVEFCIDVFAELRALGGCVPTIEQGLNGLTPLDGGMFWMIECFPTSVWRTSKLSPLPGKTRCQRNHIDLRSYLSALTKQYSLNSQDLVNGSHDDLQALVAALPIAGLLGGPAKPVARGKDSWKADEGRWVEGIIWDCESSCTNHSENVVSDIKNTLRPDTDETGANPLLIDDRDETQAEIIRRGIRIFEKLCEYANDGNPMGCGYAQFVKCLFGLPFNEVVGRNYSQSDTRNVLQLAKQITEEAGGRRTIGRGGTTIPAGLDAFIWRTAKPHDRSNAAFDNEPFTKEDWLKVFPDGERMLVGEEFERWLNDER